MWRVLGTAPVKRGKKACGAFGVANDCVARVRVTGLRTPPRRMVNYEKIRLSVAFMLAALLVPTSPYRTMALLGVRRAAASARHPLLQQTPRFCSHRNTKPPQCSIRNSGMEDELAAKWKNEMDIKHREWWHPKTGLQLIVRRMRTSPSRWRDRYFKLWNGTPPGIAVGPLPPGWREFEDAESGDVYYVSPSGASTWERPRPPPPARVESRDS